MSEHQHVAVHGASGRMGQAVLRAAPLEASIRISAALVRPGSALIDTPLRRILGAHAPDLEFRAALDPDARVDALIDFSGSHAFDGALALALQRRAAFISGTTGLGDTQQAALERASRSIPVLWASNFSMGVALLTRFARMAARALPDWDCEIVEMHHRRKADAPSGTALTIGEAIADARATALKEHLTHGRNGIVGARPEGEIGFHALRGGDVVGDHSVLFASEGERLELSHRAGNRDIFARGALLAARRLALKPPGRYALDDIFEE
ncbi:MAG: 4-hydroxy-tetrahydrodipicolinate reductase [Tahibacter sp.]